MYGGTADYSGTVIRKVYVVVSEFLIHGTFYYVIVSGLGTHGTE